MLKMDDILLVEKPVNNFRISWKMTNWCNYRCKYCYMSSQVRAAQKQDSLEFLKSISSKIDRLIELSAKGRKVVLHLIGGEVGYYDLISVLDEIKSPQLKAVIIPTNFSNSIDYWRKLKDYCHNRDIRCNIVASLHLTECNIDEFVDKCKKLDVHVKCVISPENVKQYRPILDDLLANGNVVEPTIERYDNNKCRQDFEEDDWNWILHLNDELAKRHTYYIVTTKDGQRHKYGSNIAFINDIDIGGFDPNGWMCSCGEDNLRIDQIGRLLRGGCRHCYIHPLGSLFDESTYEKLPLKPWICNTNEEDDKGIAKLKLCTAFSNATIWRES